MWEIIGDRTELQHIDPPPNLLAITAFLSRSPGLLNQGPEGPASPGHVPQSSIFSSTGLISKLSIGGPEAPSAGWWLSLPHLVTNGSGLQTLNRGSRGPFCWVLAFSNASCHQRVWSPNSQSGVPRPLLLGTGFLYRILSPTGLVSKLSIGGPEAPSAGCWLSLPHLVTNASGLQNNFLSSPSYIIVQRPPSCGRHKCTHSTHPRSGL